ncbi:MAG: hypothetical protein E7661_07160 [Ruminococcaceae bacterium]|nr:hypothetical protein [Oscillospiraceae bacterium]
MKKLIFLALTLMLLGALCVIGVAAYGTPGFYCGGSEENFSSVGDVQITWDPDAADKLDLRDGDLTDWLNAGYPYITITPENMISWVGGSWDNPTGGVPEGWSVSAFYVADPDCLYIGLYVTDPDVMLVRDPLGYNGDAFQMAFDFDRALGKFIEEDPDLYPNALCIFYSFGPMGAEATPIQIMRQNSDGNDGLLTEETSEGGVRGSTALTDEGWFAEFAFTWDQLYFDFEWKAYADDYRCEVSEDDPLEVGCALYYLDRDETGWTVNWAAATLAEQEVGVQPEVTWGPADNGMRLFVEYREDLWFNCENIKVSAETEKEEEKDPSENEELIIDPTRLTSFPEDIYDIFFAGPNQTEIIFNDDGSVTFKGTWDETTATLDPFVSFYYGNLMRRYVDKKLQNVPNKNGEYSSLVLKVKIDESVAGNFLLYYAVGRGNSTIDGSNVAYPDIDGQVGAGGYQYIIFDLEGYPFAEDIISVLRFDWVDNGMAISEDNIGASMTLYEICLYEDFETALVACGITDSGEEPDEEDTKAPEETDTDAPFEEPTEEPTEGATDEPVEEPTEEVTEAVTEPVESEPEAETTPVTEPEGESGQMAETKPAETKPGSSWKDEDKDDEDDDKDDDKDKDDDDDDRETISIGCSGVILSTLGTSLMAVLAAAWVLRKKED